MPALFASSVADSFELCRLLQFIKDNLTNASISTLNIFQDGMQRVADVQDYHALQGVKDRLREDIYNNNFTIVNCKASSFKNAINTMLKRLKKGLLGLGELPAGYICYHLSNDGYTATEMPCFLESAIKKGYLCTKSQFSRVYKALKNSELYDSGLKLFKATPQFSESDIEYGRICQFTEGYLEHSSAFLHMNFKLLLMLLKKGLYNQFYSELKNSLPCFMPPEVYGRSVLENCSFIATSNNPNKQIVGKGYYGRLTGANAEILNIFCIVNLGHSPFTAVNGEVFFTPQPIIHRALFKDGRYSFVFKGTPFTVVNPTNHSTYSKNVRLERIEVVENGVTTSYSNLPSSLTNDVRKGKFSEVRLVYTQIL